MKKKALISGSIIIAAFGVATYFMLSDDEYTFIDWSYMSPARPTTKRVFGTEIYKSSGADYLWINYGNGIEIRDINDNLKLKSGSLFLCRYCPLQLFGDYDHGLFNYSYCDECSYGVAQCGQFGTVLFRVVDIGYPFINETEAYQSDQNNKGAFTFVYNNNQYMIITGQPGTACKDVPGVWRIDGVNQIEEILCLEAPSMNKFYVLNGMKNGDILYLFDMVRSRIVVYEIINEFNIQFIGDGPSASSNFTKNARINGNLMIAKDKIYDISQKIPVLIVNFHKNNIVSSSISSDVAFLSQNGLNAYIYDIRNINNPVLIMENFWNTDNIWNQYEYETNMDVTLLDNTAFFGRCSVGQKINIELPVLEIFSDGFESGDISSWS